MILHMYFFITEVNTFRGDSSNVSAKTASLMSYVYCTTVKNLNALTFKHFLKPINIKTM